MRLVWNRRNGGAAKIGTPLRLLASRVTLFNQVGRRQRQRPLWVRGHVTGVTWPRARSCRTYVLKSLPLPFSLGPLDHAVLFDEQAHRDLSQIRTRTRRKSPRISFGTRRKSPRMQLAKMCNSYWSRSPRRIWSARPSKTLSRRSRRFGNSQNL